MKVLIQWATSTVADWVEYDITSMSQVRALPKKPVPSDSPIIDNDLGWISAVNIQGVVFASWDHLGFDIDGGVLVVCAWNDDAADWPAVPWGVVYRFDTPAPDPAFGGQVNTRQTVTRFADSATVAVLAADPEWGPMFTRPWWQSAVQWSDFPTPKKNETIHGVWVDEAHNEALSAARGRRSWREWVT